MVGIRTKAAHISRHSSSGEAQLKVASQCTITIPPPPHPNPDSFLHLIATKATRLSYREAHALPSREEILSNHADAPNSQFMHRERAVAAAAAAANLVSSRRAVKKRVGGIIHGW